MLAADATVPRWYPVFGDKQTSLSCEVGARQFRLLSHLQRKSGICTGPLYKDLLVKTSGACRQVVLEDSRAPTFAPPRGI